MLHVARHKLRIVALILVRILLVQITGIVGLKTAVLRRRKAELSGTTGLCQHSLHGSLCLAVLGQDSHIKGINATRQQIVAITYRSLQERAFRFLGKLLQTVVQHAHGSILHIAGKDVSQITLQ